MPFLSSFRRSGSRLSLLSLFLLLFTAHVASAKVLYVKGISGLDTNDGLSWNTAKKTVTAAMMAAASGDQVWVSKGTYTEAITLTTGVGLYGGFAGTETNLNNRNLATNPTILDANGNDGVAISNGDVNTVLDSFILRNAGSQFGGVNYSVRCSGSPTIANNIVQNNTYASAGIYCNGGAPKILNNQVLHNGVINNINGTTIGIACDNKTTAVLTGNLIAYNSGYGIECDNNSAPVITRCQLIGNGGGLACNGASPVVKNNLITWNTASNGGVYLNRSAAILTNNTIVYNSGFSLRQGGITLDFNNNNGGIDNNTYAPVIANNIVADNSAGILRTQAAATKITPTLSYNCLFGNSGFDVSGLTAGATDLFTDPQLLDLLRGDYHLSSNSPCIDGGSDTYVAMGDTDIDGDARLTYAHVDIGADEFVAPRTVVPTRHVVYVSPSGNANNDGFTWATAKNKVQDAVSIAYGGDLVWVAAGTYKESVSLSNAGVTLYGGFNGTETDATQRKPAVNVTTIDGGSSLGGSNLALTVSNAGPTTWVEGFTLHNGVTCNSSPTLSLNTITGTGTGVNIGSYSPVIVNNTITGNSNYGITIGGNGGISYGVPRIVGNTISSNKNGGIQVNSTDVSVQPLIVANTILNNTGTGVSCSFASPLISRNTITGNVSASASGGGIYCTSSSPSIVSNIIAGNSAPDGAGIYLTKSSPIISNNTLANNAATKASMAGGISMVTSCNPNIASNILAFNTGYGLWRQNADTTCNPVLSHNDVFGNTANYTGLQGSPDDFSADPLFASASTGNYHLGRTSPCINAGDNLFVLNGAQDRDGRARIFYGLVDVGAYEFGQRFDFNNDRVADLLFQNQQNGALGCWFMNNTRYQSSAVLATSVPTEWKVVATADLNSDQNLDLLFQNQNTGAVAYWLLNGTTLTASGTIAASVPTEWQVVAAPDLNADGMPDLLWQNTRTGDVVCWFLNGVTFLRYTTIATAVPLDWKIVATADINGDGMPDLLWQNQKSGAVAYWLMNGTTVIGSGQIAASVPLVWKVMGAPDLNGDGKADLLWANQQTGDVTYWLLDGSTLIGSGTISSGVPLAWQLAGMR